jgi:hypothetical protein
MNKSVNSVASIGVTNLTTMGTSKLVTFAGATLTFIGVGGMLLSNKTLTEPEVKYLREHINMK